MKIAPSVDEIRRLVADRFQHFGAGKKDVAQLRETILIQEGRYYGRSYRTGRLMAMWLVDVGILQFYSADGSMLGTVNLLQEMHSIEAAA